MPMSMLHVPVDEDTQKRATDTLEAMGLTLSDAVVLFLHRVIAHQAMPFDVHVPNADTLAAMAEADAIVASWRLRFQSADGLFSELERTRGR